MPASLSVSTDANPRKLSLEQLGHLQRAQRRFVRKYHGGGKDYRRHKRAAEETLRRKIKIPRKQAGLPVEAQRIRAAFVGNPSHYKIPQNSVVLALLPLDDPKATDGAGSERGSPDQTNQVRRDRVRKHNKKELKRRLAGIDWQQETTFVIGAPLETTKRGAVRNNMAIRLLPRVGAAIIPADTPAFREALISQGFEIIDGEDISLIEPTEVLPAGSGTKKAVEAADDDDLDLVQSKSLAATGGDDPKGPQTLADQSFASFDLSEDRRGRGGRGVVIGVLDTGVYESHEQFTGRTVVQAAFDEKGRKRSKVDLENPHGTHVAALAAGNDGVAPETVLISAKVLSGERGRGTPSQLFAGIEWILETVAERYSDLPVVVIASLGAKNPKLARRMERIITKSEAHDAGGFFAAAAAGNDGAIHPVQYPAAMPEFIAVGALSGSGTVSPSTNQGGATVDIFALGTRVVSAGLGGRSAYLAMTGSSMATPLVGGSLARLIASNPAYWTSVSQAEALDHIRDEDRHLTVRRFRD